MKLCWYKTSWRSGSLWLGNIQQTLIECHLFPPLKGNGKKTPNNILILSSVYQPRRHWRGSEIHHNISLCVLHTAHNPLLLMRSVLLEPATHSMRCRRCQAQALLLHLRHYLSSSWASSYMLPFHTENFTQTFPLSSSFAFFFSFIFSWKVL